MSQRWSRAIYIGLIIVLLTAILALDTHQTKTITLWEWFRPLDYIETSLKISTEIGDKLKGFGLRSYDILEVHREARSRGPTQWIHTSQVVIVPPFASLDRYSLGISQAAKASGARVFGIRKILNAGERSLIIDVGARLIPIYQIWLKQPILPPPKARVAIIIDDLGGGGSVTHDLLEVNRPLTFSILPHLPRSRRIANEAFEGGQEVMLHLPMEPYGYPKTNPGPGAIFMEMAPHEIITKLLDDLKTISHVKGVNNHMGSRMTEDENMMEIILREIQTEGLFFIDSRTTQKSVAYRVARRLGMRAAYRQVFLDNVNELGYIKAQLRLLAKAALDQGQAIGIGHPRRNTVRAIREAIASFESQGIKLVHASALVE
jgi:polysaccharide deacetylase 2 family uncharacterized protein YibQ